MILQITWGVKMAPANRIRGLRYIRLAECVYLGAKWVFDWVVIYKTWWLLLDDAQTRGQRNYKGVIVNHEVPPEALMSPGKLWETTGFFLK